MAFVPALCCGLATAAVVEVAVFSLGFLTGTYDYFVDKLLKGGNLYDEKLRDVFVRDVNKIKSSIVSIAIKDLKTSLSHLFRGLELLNLAHGTSNEDQKASEATGSTAGEATSVRNDTASVILKSALKALAQTTQSESNFVGNKRFLSAQECFKNSSAAAINAYNNKALIIKDRIMAFKLCMAATLLDLGHEDPEAAITACRKTLEELHDLPEVQRMFSVFLKGGWKARWKKKARLENMKSVVLINYALVFFAFNQLKCRKYSMLVELFKNWPVINLTRSTFHPILDASKISEMDEVAFIQLTLEAFKKAFEEVSQRIERVIEDSRILKCKYFAVNSCHDIILLTDGKITVIYRTGETKDVTLPKDNAVKRTYEIDKGLAVDSNAIYSNTEDNLYVVRLRGQSDENDRHERQEYVLYVIDKDCNIVNTFVLHFLDARVFKDVQIAVDQIGSIVITKEDDKQVYICDDTGQLKSNFERDGVKLVDLDISGEKDIMIVSDDRSAVCVHTAEGNLKCTLQVPEGHKAGQVAFHHIICKIIVLTHVAAAEEGSWALLYYSETGELKNSVIFCESEEIWTRVTMTSSPSGSVVVRFMNSVTFINDYFV